MTQTVFYTIFFAFIISMMTLAWSFLPSASEYPLPNEVGESFELLVGYMRMFDFIFPFDTLFTVLTLGIALEVAIFLWHRLWWIIGIIRGVGANGI